MITITIFQPITSLDDRSARILTALSFSNSRTKEIASFTKLTEKAIQSRLKLLKKQWYVESTPKGLVLTEPGNLVLKAFIQQKRKPKTRKDRISKSKPSLKPMALSRTVSKKPVMRKKPIPKPKPVTLSDDVLSISGCQVLAVCAEGAKFEAITANQYSILTVNRCVALVSALLEQGYLHYSSETGLYTASEGGLEARSKQLKLNASRLCQ